MGSFAMEEFVGDGVLTGLIPRFVAVGWDNVPTLKMLSSEDMDWLKLTQQQKKLTPEYKVGAKHLVKTKAPPVKASDLWAEKPTVLLCIRRPGCIMCRAEAHQLYSRKPIFDALGFQLVAVLHEQIEPEVREFWPRYWGGMVVLDQTLGFFKALGGGQLLKENFLTGFVLNSRAIANYKAARATGFGHNFRGEGEVKGGMFVVRTGKGGVAYQFIERNFGDWAPIAEVVEICRQIQDSTTNE